MELEWRRAGRKLVNAPRRIQGQVIRAANDPAFRNAVAGMKHLLLTGFSTDCVHEAADAAIRDAVTVTPTPWVGAHGGGAGFVVRF